MNIKEIKATKSSWQRGRNDINLLKVAAYCRVSTDDEDQLNSYESQKEHYTNLIKEKEEWQFVGIYADAAITGTKVTNRVDFKRMIDCALLGDIDMIITKSIARFARNTYDTLKYVRMLKEHSVAVFFEEENINTMTMDGELLLTILSSVAQQEVENISANVKKGLKMKMKRGELMGFVSCLGYDYDKETKAMSINHEEAKIVKYIFERYSAGAGATIISRELNEKGIKTNKGNKWGHSTVLGIIKNEKYIGDLLMGKSFTVDPISKRRLPNHGEEDMYYITDHHEPIIDRETYNKAHEILKKRSFNKRSADPNLVREKYSRKYAFSSLLECGYCGSNLSRRSWHSNNKYRKVIWQCVTSSKKGKQSCQHSKGIPEELIEMAFLESYKMIAGHDKELINTFVDRVESTLGSNEVHKRLIKQEKILDEVLKKKRKLVNLLLDESIDKKMFDSSVYELTEREEALKSDSIVNKFDRHIFESLIEKVIVGSIDDDGNIDPYKLTFIYKTGLSNKIDGEKHRVDKRRKQSVVLPSNDANDDSTLLSNTSDDACGDGDKIRSSRLISKYIKLV